MASLPVEKFGVQYRFEDRADGFVRIQVTKPEPDGWLGEIQWPGDDLLGFYHALGDFLMFSSRMKEKED